MFILDNKGRQSLHVTIYNQIKSQIVSGKLPGNTKLPSIRNLSAELSVSHSTVEYAYQQLFAEGYIHSKARSGYYVSLLEPEFSLPSLHHTGTPTKHALESEKSILFDFHPACLSPESFPVNIWRKLYTDCLKEDPKQLSLYSDQQGLLELRFEIQRYLARSRGVSCEPEQILICSGLQDSLSILAPILKENHSSLAMEEPGYFIPKAVFKNHNFSLSPIPVNSDGIDLQVLENSNSTVAYVTPSHQFPLGHVMPIANRLKLIDWAKSVGGVIIEDDYDSELRYHGKPIPAMQGLHPRGNIVYVGTFSKVLSPALRVSYMVLPYELLKMYHKLFSNYSNNVSVLEQKTLCKFMEQGYWERYLRKIRNVYKKKHDVLIQAIHHHFGSRVNIIGQGAGLHVVLELVDNFLDEEELIKRALEREARLFPLSTTYLCNNGKHSQIMLGFGGISNNEIDRGIERLYQAWY
jgi:GntR family transcriptional regulator/MocR family aminotransferase